MAFTFTLAGTAFGDLSLLIGAYALDWRPQVPIEDLQHDHIPGTDLTVIVDAGIVAHRWTAVCRYADTDQKTAIDELLTCLNAWRVGGDCVSPDGTTYKRCRPVAVRVVRVFATGREGTDIAATCLDVEIDWESYGDDTTPPPEEPPAP
jgi:hypothetical protein